MVMLRVLVPGKFRYHFLSYFLLIHNQKEVITIKSRKQKKSIYENKYSHIPRDYNQRLEWLYDTLHINPVKENIILQARDQYLQSMSFSPEILVILYEEPEGSPRPRARFVNKANLSISAKSNPGFIQVYSITGASDRQFMKQFITDNDFLQLEQLICTPCNVEFNAFFKTPSSFNSINTFLAELGCIRPISKPDFDNIEKKYADMYNGNIWIDDALVVDGIIRKFYSVLPRVEIHLRFLNMLYNKHQFDSISKRIDSSNVNYFDYTKKE